MHKRKFGRTGLALPELGLNAAKFGGTMDEDTARAVLDAYRDQGGAFIQTLGSGPNIAERQPVDAPSEEIVGRWLKTRSVDRRQIVLATRLALTRPSLGGTISLVNLIRELCESSLRRLQTNHLDLLVFEWDERLVPVSDVIEAADMLTRAGLIRYAVAGGFPPWRVVDSLHRSSLRNQCRFEGIQANHSLVARARLESEALAMCKEHRLGFIARSPFAGGFLVRTPAMAEGGWLRERIGIEHREAVRLGVRSIAEQRLISPAQVALAWVLRNRDVSSVLLSVSSREQLLDAVRALAVALTDAEIETLAQAGIEPGERLELSES